MVTIPKDWPPEPYVLIKPININVYQNDVTDFIATVSVLDISASGDDAKEAVDNLLEYILDSYDILTAIKEELGPAMISELKRLKAHIKRKETKEEQNIEIDSRKDGGS